MAKQINDKRIEFSVDTKAADKLNKSSVPGSAVPNLSSAPTISKDEVASVQQQGAAQSDQVQQPITVPASLVQQEAPAQSQTHAPVQQQVETTVTQAAQMPSTMASTAPQSQPVVEMPAHLAAPTSMQQNNLAVENVNEQIKQQKNTNEVSGVNNVYTPGGPYGTRYHTNDPFGEKAAREKVNEDQQVQPPVGQHVDSVQPESKNEKSSKQTSKRSRKQNKKSQAQTDVNDSDGVVNKQDYVPTYTDLIFNDDEHVSGEIILEPWFVKKHGGTAESVADAVYEDMFKIREENFTKPVMTNAGIPRSTGSTLDRKVVNKLTQDNEIAQRQERVRKQIIRLFRNPYMLRVKGSKPMLYKRADGKYGFKIAYPKDLRDYLNRISEESGLIEERIIQSAILHAGIGLDSSNGEFYFGGWWGGKTDSTKGEIKQKDLMMIIDDAMESIKKYGHPCGLTGRTINFHGTKCYPVGYISNQFATDLMSDLKYAQDEAYKRVSFNSYYDMREAVKKQWNEVTNPTLIDETSFDNIEQTYAIYNMTRAFIEEGGDDITKYGISYFVDAHLTSVYREMEEIQIREGDVDVLNAVNSRAEKETEAFNTWLNQWYRISVNKNSEGKPISTRLSYKGRTLDSFFQWLLSMERFNSLFLNIPIAISNWIEHASSSAISTKFANAMYSRQVNNNANFRYSDFIRDSTTSNEGKEAYKLLLTMYDIGGFALIDAYNKYSGKDFTKDNVLAFVNAIKNGSLDNNIKMDKEELSDLKEQSTKLLYRINEVISDIATGSMMLSGVDANNFMQNLMLNMSLSDSMQRTTVTTNTIEDSIRSQGIANTMVQLLSRPEGKDAYISSVNLSAGRISPWTYLVNNALKRNGITSFFLSNFTSVFLRYNVAFMELMIPMSNTMNYFAVHNLTKGKFDSSLRDNTLGGQFLNGEVVKDNPNFWQGVKKCIKYDLARMSSFGAVALLMTAISLFLGIDEPEDKTRLYDPFAWIANESFIPAWWLNDIVGWGLPLGVSIAIWMKTGDPILFSKNFVNGLASMMDSNVIFETISFLRRGPERIVDGMEAVDKGDANAAPSIQSYFTNMALDKGAEIANRLTPLSGATNWIYRGDSVFIGNEMFDYNSNKVYDTEHYTMEEAKEKDKTTYVDYDEAKARERSKKYWTSAAFNNLARNKTLPWEGETEKETGYFIWQQPVKKYNNPKFAKFFELNDFDPEDPELALAEDGGASIREQKVEDDLATLLEYDSPEQFAAQGGFLTYDTRYMIQRYLYEQKSNLLIAASENNKNLESLKTEVYNSEEYDQLMASYQWSGSDLWNELQSFKEKNQDAWTEYNKADAYYDYILNYWIWNDNIPYSNGDYSVYKTDYRGVYTWSDSGEPATIVDYWVFPDKVKKTMYRLGNRPSSLLPFTSMVQEDVDTYNNETPLSFYNEDLTDTTALFQENQGVTVEQGYHTGKDLNSVLFGGSSDVPNASDVDYAIQTHGAGESVDGYDMPTIGIRGLKSENNADLTKELKDFKFADYCEEEGIDLDKLMGNKDSSTTNSTTSTEKSSNKGKTFVPYRGWSSGSRGSSYSPKIYSRGSNAYFNGKAYLMQDSRPYNTSLGYLKPSHYTQGSRDAYRRAE